MIQQSTLVVFIIYFLIQLLNHHSHQRHVIRYWAQFVQNSDGDLLRTQTPQSKEPGLNGWERTGEEQRGAFSLSSSLHTHHYQVRSEATLHWVWFFLGLLQTYPVLHLDRVIHRRAHLVTLLEYGLWGPGPRGKLVCWGPAWVEILNSSLLIKSLH